MKIKSYNPSNYQEIGEAESSTPQEVIDKVSKARNAFPKWSVTSLEERCKKVTSFIELSKQRSEEIAQLIAKETGRPILSARGNVAGGIQYFEHYCKTAKKYLSPEVTVENDTEIHKIYHEPRGVVAAILPWNYPYMNVVWQCGQALIAGNTIVYKNSKETILFSKLLEELIKLSDIPDGVFNIVYGDSQVGEILVSQDVDMISFTGSTDIGIQLTQIAAKKFIPIVTELGGSAPCIICEDIEITDQLIEYMGFLRLVNNGQACDAIKRLIVHKSKLKEVIEKLKLYFSKQKIGNALDEATNVGPLVSRNQLDILEKQVLDSVNKGANIIVGGKTPQGLKGAYYEPTILTNITKDMSVWKEEVFGPVLPIVSFDTEEEAIELANDTEYGLTAHIMTKDKLKFNRISSQIKAGTVAQNMVPYWNPSNPFGGYNKSGMGRLHGPWGFHDFTQIKLVSEEK